MSNPILIVKNGGFGETPVPKDAILQPGDDLTVHRECEEDTSTAKIIAVVPVGVSVDIAIADQNGEARPLMLREPTHKETLYVIEADDGRFLVPQSKIAEGLQRASDAGLTEGGGPYDA